MSIPVILASSSPSRRALLLQAGICPTIRVSRVDEDAVIRRFAANADMKVEDMPTEQRVMVLSRAKAHAVQAAYREQENTINRARRSTAIEERVNPLIGRTTTELLGGPLGTIAANPGLAGLKKGPLLIGSDSMFEFDGVAYGKPHTAEKAFERIAQMRGKSGTLWTGHTLIDLASGRELSEISSARVHFADYSDEEIRAYVETGEPLEVAGSFTLEGLGGAFIDSVSGDPHGIQGLSLPLVRQMATRLGFFWPDLWNLKRDKRGRLAINGDSRALLKHVSQPGDGFIDCACGHKHWGLHGAAGVLLFRRDTFTGEITHVALQRRAVWSMEGGTWGNPGGALSTGESPFEGGLREAWEEAGIAPQDIDIVGAHTEDHGPWAYTTLLAFERVGHSVKPHVTDNESIDVVWKRVSDVESLPLLSYFKVDWLDDLHRARQISRAMANN